MKAKQNLFGADGRSAPKAGDREISGLFFARFARSLQDRRQNFRCVAAVEARAPRGVELNDRPATSSDEANINDDRTDSKGSSLTFYLSPNGQVAVPAPSRP